MFSFKNCWIIGTASHNICWILKDVHLVLYTYIVLQIYSLTLYIFTANLNIANYCFGVGTEETVEESSWGINWSVDLLWFTFYGSALYTS